MEALHQIAGRLIKDNSVQVIIGMGKSRQGRTRPIFIQKLDQVDSLSLDETVSINPAVYLLKPEIKKMGKPALVANLPVLRSVIQLAAEQQVKENDLVLIHVSSNGAKQVQDLAAAQALVEASSFKLSESDQSAMERLERMSLQERWQYWQEELSRCFKCYACRAACPMCYCSRCTVDCNQPQWISVPAHPLGNFEWHMMRAMHLAGRCVSCGACGAACPLDIPIHLLTMKVEEDIFREFGSRAGMSRTADHALSTFQPQDKESFIR